MYQKFARALQKLHRGQKGITGLETAIILIAFVTVASVLAYSVLSAGIFSAERGKETVYEGLEHAKATMETRGAVLAKSSDNTSVDHIIFQISCVLQGEVMDFTEPPNHVTVITYQDESVDTSNITWAATLLSQERGSVDMLEADEVFQVDVTVPAAASLVGYDTFTLEIIPPKGAAVRITRTIPGSVRPVMNLN